MTIEIKNKITGYEVVSNDENVAETGNVAPEKATDKKGAEIIQMHEKLERPDMLLGSTYKIKPHSPSTHCTSRSMMYC